MSRPLPSINCPGCGEVMPCRPYEGKPEQVKKYSDCLRQCTTCGIGYSNAKNAPVLIYEEPKKNVPEAVRDGLAEALATALNEFNRENKHNKFGFATSEDARTWTVFSYLARSNALAATMRSLVPEISDWQASPALLLWGVPVPDSPSGSAIRQRLLQISDFLKERRNRRSEPDVVVVCPSGAVAFIEVKFRSGNEVKKPDYEGWSKRGYLRDTDAFTDPRTTVASGLYELARNWRFAWELADGKPFALVNLGLDKLLLKDAHRVEQFQRSLNTSHSRRFLSKHWPKLIDNIPSKPEWLVDYARASGLV